MVFLCQPEQTNTESGRIKVGGKELQAQQEMKFTWLCCRSESSKNAFLCLSYSAKPYSISMSQFILFK